MSKLWSKKYNLKECRGCGSKEKPHRANGLCAACYNRYWHDKTKENDSYIWRKRDLYEDDPNHNVCCPYCGEVFHSNKRVKVVFEGTCVNCFRDFRFYPLQEDEPKSLTIFWKRLTRGEKLKMLRKIDRDLLNVGKTDEYGDFIKKFKEEGWLLDGLGKKRGPSKKWGPLQQNSDGYIMDAKQDKLTTLEECDLPKVRLGTKYGEKPLAPLELGSNC